MILAIDPGSEKTGIAVVEDDGALLHKEIAATVKLREVFDRIYTGYRFTTMVMGDGTNHRRLQPVAEQWIHDGGREIAFALVDEKFTTVEGRALYWKYTPRRGWRRFWPLSLQYPPEPVDDFVAWIIGLRYLRQRGEKL
ncbi:hypothetical protein [Megasphaera vaginalis (ex Srinivasan et al. 2021)]|uniref:YqgF/RNase H-like domain-containing protein n=1 Tax=Megasphaera vaginalis (ex Srinivasan et al. 2021) TaxID=1111454 RepID=U7UJQ5_9FIRM|nr:hypothetical protein [Megasphaera vaginalis (ex Srinivasan et al. 2021)]ERT59632.1 hypothetical protein HMPREF1250_0730 [Megasphaera vaginalis (ex Srinivasan et al. 2021)]